MGKWEVTGVMFVASSRELWGVHMAKKDDDANEDDGSGFRDENGREWTWKELKKFGEEMDDLDKRSR